MVQELVKCERDKLKQANVRHDRWVRSYNSTNIKLKTKKQNERLENTEFPQNHV